MSEQHLVAQNSTKLIQSSEYGGGKGGGRGRWKRGEICVVRKQEESIGAKKREEEAWNSPAGPPKGESAKREKD